MADDDLAIEDARRAVHVAQGVFAEIANLPDYLAACCIERGHQPVGGAEHHLALGIGNALVAPAHVQRMPRPAARTAVELPQQRPAHRIESADVRMAGGDEQSAIGGDRAGGGIAGLEIEMPCQRQVGDVARVDLVERTVMLLARRAPEAGPVLRVDHERRIVGMGRTAPARGKHCGRQNQAGDGARQSRYVH